MAKRITIEGKNIQDIYTFYEEINRVFMVGEDWRLGASLDGLDDVLYGGYGAIAGNEQVELIWVDFEKNRRDLGLEATRNYYLRKIEQPVIFNVDWAKSKLEELEKGTGQTYFDIILEIILSHANIKLIQL